MKVLLLIKKFARFEQSIRNELRIGELRNKLQIVFLCDLLLIELSMCKGAVKQHEIKIMIVRESCLDLIVNLNRQLQAVSGFFRVQTDVFEFIFRRFV